MRRIEFSTRVGLPDERGCMEWSGPVNNRGYGVASVTVGEKRMKTSAHRIAYRLAIGHDPAEMDVLHRCDNRKCCNPEHLFLGTAADNVADMLSKGRQKRSKFTEDDLSDIALLRGYGMTQQEIADEYRVSRPLISMLLSGKIMASSAHINS